MGLRRVPSLARSSGRVSIVSPTGNHGFKQRRWQGLAVAVAVAALLIPAAATQAAKPPGTPPGDVDVQLLAINDFHGNLKPPTGSSGFVGTTLAGGVEYLATHIKTLEATNPDRTLEIAAGDLIGASPLISAAFHDEPTIEAMNAVGLDISAVGNHEFDEGVDELLRIQNGGCHPVDGCQDGDGYDGAGFQYLAANVVYKSNGKPIFPAYKIRSLGGAKIGFIGLTLEGTPDIVSANGIQTVNFLDEADTINAATQELKAKGVHTIVVLLHEGGAQSVGLSTTTINTCTNMSGAILDIVARLDDEVDMVVSGHTHTAYNCLLPNASARPIPVSSGASFGRLVTDIDMTINRASDEPTQISVNNVVVTRTVAADPAETTLIAKYDTAIAPIANQIVGSITADITRTNNAAGESALGDVIGDAQLAYTQAAGSQFAFMNPGGIRADLVYGQISGGEAAGQVTYGEAFTVQPFNNLVVTQSLTGAQIKTALEQSFIGCLGRTQGTVILQVSAGFSYAYDSTLPCGSRITAINVNSNPIVPGTTYKVAMNNFLADGGDSFPAFKGGTGRVYAPGFDVDALTAYLGAHAPVAPGPQNRITVP
jgi:5'-nucleotidase